MKPVRPDGETAEAPPSVDHLPEVLKLIRTGGVIASYASTQVREPKLPVRQMMFMDLTVRLVIVYSMPEPAKVHAIADIDRALRAGRLHHRVAHRLPLAKVVRSHELIEQGGFRGCVVRLIAGRPGPDRCDPSQERLQPRPPRPG